MSDFRAVDLTIPGEGPWEVIEGHDQWDVGPWYWVALRPPASYRAFKSSFRESAVAVCAALNAVGFKEPDHA